jgi:protein SCO1
MPTTKPARLLRLVLLISSAPLALSAGCRAPADDAQARRYELRGVIVSFDKGQQQIVVAHEEVPGLMEPMTMPFTLREPTAYDVMKPGAEIRATLVVSGARTWLESPVITVREPAGSAAPAAATPAEPEPGAAVPDFSLVNQDGERLDLGRYRGRALALTFIYTRCPLPEYCTLMSTNFAEVNRALESDPALASKTRLLSVSIDPEHDTPKALRSYGAAHTGNYSEEKFRTWEFATGEPEEVKRFATFFGLAYTREGAEVVHSLRTAVVTPDGKLHKLYRGNEWKPAELIAELRKLATP